MFNLNQSILEFNQFLVRRGLVYDHILDIRNQFRSIENSFIRNCLQRFLQTNNNLKIILGESTQNHENYIYSGNIDGLRRQRFLPASFVCTEPEIQNFDPQLYFSGLVRNNIIVLDAYPLPIPANFYRSGFRLGIDVIKAFMEYKVSLFQRRLPNITNIAIVKRYKSIDDNVISIIEEAFKNSYPNITFQFDAAMGSLSDSAGNLDREKFNNFILQH